METLGDTLKRTGSGQACLNNSVRKLFLVVSLLGERIVERKVKKDCALLSLNNNNNEEEEGKVAHIY